MSAKAVIATEIETEGITISVRSSGITGTTGGIATGTATEDITISVNSRGITDITGVTVRTSTITSAMGIARAATGVAGKGDNRFAATVTTVMVRGSR